MLIAGSVNILIGITCSGLRSSHWTRGAWLATLYLAVFGSLAGYTSYMFLLRNVRLSTVATYAYVNPIVAVLLNWALLHETLHGSEWVGMAIVLASLAAVIASRPRTAKSNAEATPLVPQHDMSLPHGALTSKDFTERRQIQIAFTFHVSQPSSISISPQSADQEGP